MSHCFNWFGSSLFFNTALEVFILCTRWGTSPRFHNSLSEPTSTAGRRITGIGIINMIWGLPEWRKLLDKPPNRRFDLSQPVFPLSTSLDFIVPISHDSYRTCNLWLMHFSRLLLRPLAPTSSTCSLPNQPDPPNPSLLLPPQKKRNPAQSLYKWRSGR